MRKFWTPTEHERLLDLHDAGSSDQEIAALLGRTPHAVRLRRWRLFSRTGGGSTYHASDVARIFGVSSGRVRRWLGAGWLAGKRCGLRRSLCGGEWRVTDRAIRAFVADRRHWARWSLERMAPAWRPFVDEVRTVRLIPVAEAADRLGYHPRVIQHWIKSGRLRGVRGAGKGGKARALYVFEDALEPVA
jgi:hypothetical protein